MEFAGSCPGLSEHVETAREDLEASLEEQQDVLSG